MPLDPVIHGPQRVAFRVLVAITLVASFALVAPVAAAAAPTYLVEDLGTLSGDATSVAMGINATGQVVGWSGSVATRAFVSTDGAGMVALAAPAGRPVTTARAINDSGAVAGNASTGGSDIGQAVRWTGGVPDAFGTLGTGLFSDARSIDSAGVTVGSSYTDGGGLLGIHAFRTRADGSLFDLTPVADTARAEGINDAGQIAGYRDGRAVRWEGGSVLDLGTAGFGFSFGSAINDSGQVAGSVSSSSGNVERIFRYTDGIGMVVLGGLGEHNVALGMNNAGDVVGSGRPTLGTTVFPSAFLFTDVGGMVDLNTLIDPASGWVLKGAGDINDEGQIAAWGSNNLTGTYRALRLTPVVADTTAPSVRFAYPSDGIVVSGAVKVKIVAGDDVAVRRVALQIDGVVTCSTTTSTVLSCVWRTRRSSAGSHTLTAVAIDTSGNRTTRSIAVTVQR
jgi:probable HAF family extracellular repeat protein